MHLKTKSFFSLITLITFVASTTSDPSQQLISFLSTFLSAVLPFLFLLIIVVMFIYAVLKAPLDVLKRGMIASTVLLLAQTIDYFKSLGEAFFSLLSMLLFLLLPLILILMLYKSFMVLVKSR